LLKFITFISHSLLQKLTVIIVSALAVKLSGRLVFAAWVKGPA